MYTSMEGVFTKELLDLGGSRVEAISGVKSLEEC